MQYQHKNKQELLEKFKQTAKVYKPSESKETSLIEIKPSQKHRLVNEGIDNDPLPEEKIKLNKSTNVLYGKNNLPSNKDTVSVRKTKYKLNTGVSKALPKPNGFIFSIGDGYEACIYQGSISLYDADHNVIMSDIMAIDNDCQVFMARNSGNLDPIIFQALCSKVDSLLIGETKTINKQSMNYSCPIVQQEYKEGESFRKYCKESYIGDAAFHTIARTHFLIWLQNLTAKKKLNFLRFVKRQNKSITYIDFVDCKETYLLFLSVFSRENILSRKIIN